MKASLKTIVCGIEFENPFILASAPPTADVDSLRKAFKCGWAGAVLKTITPDDVEIKDAQSRFAVLRSKKSNEIIGFENIELLSRKKLSYWMDAAKSLKKEFPTKILIASIMAPVKKDLWQNLVLSLQECPIDAFELNFSCPHGMPEKGMGMAIGTDAKLSKEIASWVKEKSKIPVFVKLTPNVADIAGISSVIAESGIDGFTAINTVQSLIGVDLNTLSPLPNVHGMSTFGGYSGRAIKPIGLRFAAQIKQKNKLPLLATGGVSTWQDAAEYIALGAELTQVCTEVMLNGYGIVKKMIAGLGAYMDEKGFSNLEDFRGVALSKITTHEALSKVRKDPPQVDVAKCKLCRTCETVCYESGYKAINITESKVFIDPNLCDRCSLCIHACPFNAINSEAV